VLPKSPHSVSNHGQQQRRGFTHVNLWSRTTSLALLTNNATLRVGGELVFRLTTGWTVETTTTESAAHCAGPSFGNSEINKFVVY